LVSDAQGPVAVSPDGKTIGFIRASTYIMLADSDGGNVRQLAKAADGNRYFNLSWSPKGDVIAAVYYSQTDSNDHLSQISVQDGSESPIRSQAWLRLRGVSWLPDASGLVVSGRDPDMQRSQLWEINYPGGETRRITNDLQTYNGAVLTRDGSVILSVQEKYRSNLWTSLEAADPKQISTEIGRDEGMSGVAISVDGKIAYTVRVKGDQDLWIANADGSGNRQVTFDVKANYVPVFSPDGRYLVFVSTRAGSPDIWRMDADGTNPIPLTNDPDLTGEPSFSPDGTFVYYSIMDGQRNSSIWRVSINGGPPEQITRFGSRRPVVSPDGSLMVCELRESVNDPAPKMGLVSLQSGQVVRSLDSVALPRSRIVRWSSDGKSLVFSETRDRVDNLWLLPIDGSAARQITNFNADRIFHFDITQDGRSWVMARGSEDSDVVTVSDFR
jgi:Tol biopolymer transport system component